MKTYEKCFNFKSSHVLFIVYLFFTVFLYSDQYQSYVGYLLKYETDKKESRIYKEMLVYYQKQKDALAVNDFSNAELIGNQYIKKNRNVLKKHDYINDYTYYNNLGYYIYVNALIFFQKGDFEKGNEFLYLYCYILDVFMNDMFYYEDNGKSFSFAKAYYDIFFDKILRKDHFNKNLVDIKDGKFARIYLTFFDKERRKNLFTSVVERDPMDEVSYSHLYDWDWYQMELKDDNIENKPDFTNAAPFKILTKALRIRYTDESKAKLFEKFLKEKAGLDIQIKPWALGLKKKIPGNAWLTLIRSDELGKDLMKRYIFDLK